MLKLTSPVLAAFLFLCLPAIAATPAQDLLNAGRVDDAITLLNTHVSANPDDAPALNELCRAHFAYEDWDRAEPYCQKAASLDPNNSRFHRWLGRVYGERASRKTIPLSLARKTRDEFQRAAQLDPHDPYAGVDVAEYYIEAPGFMGGGEERAREQAKTVGKISPAKEHWVYARLAEKNKDFATAEREYHQMIVDGEGGAEAWLNLAFFYRNQKRFDDMEQAIVKMSQSAMPEREDLFEGAQLLYRNGRAFSFAEELLKRYLQQPVEEAPAFKVHNLLGILYEKRGDKTGAAAEYQAALALARNYRPAQEGLRRVAP
jgi:Flp pilus assembly protein TadD